MLCIVRPAQGTPRLVEVSPPDPGAACLCLTASSEAVWCVLANGSVYVRAQVRPVVCPQGRYWQHVNLEQLGLSLGCFVVVNVELLMFFSVLHLQLRNLLVCGSYNVNFVRRGP